MSEVKYPIGGYAPGKYSCKCVDCGEEFTGDKRAVQCEGCAVEGLKKQATAKDKLIQRMWMHMNIMRNMINTSSQEWTNEQFVYKVDLGNETFLEKVIRSDEPGS